MNDEINEEQKTSEEQEVKSDALADDVLDDASGSAAFRGICARSRAWTSVHASVAATDPPRGRTAVFEELNLPF